MQRRGMPAEKNTNCIESERAFSTPGLFITIIRSTIADDTLDSLCFLKSFFKNQKNYNNMSHMS